MKYALAVLVVVSIAAGSLAAELVWPANAWTINWVCGFIAGMIYTAIFGTRFRDPVRKGADDIERTD